MCACLCSPLRLLMEAQAGVGDRVSRAYIGEDGLVHVSYEAGWEFVAARELNPFPAKTGGLLERWVGGPKEAPERGKAFGGRCDPVVPKQ
ncbi:MAG TPA: hypothetical protein VNW54_09725 [Granulicella sp.]|nr:hypothetical protein [Granulicella sp.]